MSFQQISIAHAESWKASIGLGCLRCVFSWNVRICIEKELRDKTYGELLGRAIDAS